MDKNELSDEQVLEEYKAQQSNELCPPSTFRPWLLSWLFFD